jgi:Cu(I)/Ag(I) efflux system membrane fusion protein
MAVACDRAAPPRRPCEEILMSLFPHARIPAGLARAAALAVALLAGCGESPPPAAEQAESGPADTAGDARKALYWYDPMVPQQRFDKPGRSPFMDMDLVPKYADEEAGGGDSGHAPVTLSGAVVQNLGIRTAQVQRGTLARTVRAVGRVAYDEARLAHVHPRAAGWIERLVVRAEGEPVKKGQELAALYAPDILSAQVDFLIATEPQGPGERRVKADKARNLLRLLDVPEAVIRDIERSRETRNTVPVLAPADGIVTQLTAREGMYVTPGSEMFAIADLSRVWVLVDVFEHQLAWIAPGLPAQIQVTAYPGRTWKGRVDYLYPELDPKTRTLRVRLVFPNPDLELKPNLFADVTIQGVPREALHIPREALIATGERESVVKALGEGRFQPVDVVTGMRSGETVEILSGLGEGDTVVVSGQFLIDSESSLKASFGRLSDDVPTPTPDTGHQH